MPSADTESRLPVGSSASSNMGSLANARAMATRCRSPTESFTGRWFSRWLMPTSSSNSPAFFIRAKRKAAFEHGHLHVFQRRKDGQEVERLEDEAQFLRAELVEIGHRRERLFLEEDFAGGGHVQCAQQVEQRGFAAAAGSHDGHVFALRMLRLTSSTACTSPSG